MGPPSARETPTLFQAFLTSRSGGTAIEYALIAALIAVVLLGGLQVAGSSMLNTMVYIADATTQASAP